MLCPHTVAFSPLSGFQLQNAVSTCLKLSPRGKCPKGPHGAIGTWDVSRVIDMSRLFSGAKLFNADISKWDVSRVKDMNGMFLGASSFNGDLVKWDVSSVQDMSGMFGGATLFKRTLCGAAWVNSKAKKTSMFAGSSGLISQFTCSGVCTITELRFKLVLDYPSVNHSFTSTWKPCKIMNILDDRIRQHTNIIINLPKQGSKNKKTRHFCTHSWPHCNVRCSYPSRR